MDINEFLLVVENSQGALVEITPFTKALCNSLLDGFSPYYFRDGDEPITREQRDSIENLISIAKIEINGGIPLSPPLDPEAVILFDDEFTAPEEEIEDDARVALGLRVDFLSTGGTVTHVRFYKIVGSVGHIARVWRSDGELLSEEPFISETSVGWQQVELSTPVHVDEDDNLIVSVEFENGYFARTSHFFDTDYVNEPFTVLAEVNGRYAYPDMGGFPRPTDPFNASNYYVGCVFLPD